MDIINAKDVSFIYDDSAHENYALENINMNIKKGEFVAILGHNGSGKSTIAKHFNALLLPTDGVVYVDNIDTKNHEMVWEIRKTAGMVFQNPDNQMIANIVEEEVAFGPENIGVEQKTIREYVDYALECVGMGSYAKKSPTMLSGGQKQRIAIAGILAMRPKIIVLDEPTAMLDPSGRKEVINTLLKLNVENDMTIVLITHYMDEAVLADRVIVMDDGKKIMEGVPREVFKNVKELRAIGLDVPQVTEVAYMLSERGLQISSTILTIEELVGEICRLKYEI